MATKYTLEITSHWVNYTPEDFKKMLDEALLKKDKNEFTVSNVIRK